MLHSCVYFNYITSLIIETVISSKILQMNCSVQVKIIYNTLSIILIPSGGLRAMSGGRETQNYLQF